MVTTPSATVTVNKAGSTAHNPDQVAARVDHGKPLDLEDVHQPGGVLDRILGPDRHCWVRHQVTRDETFGLLEIPVMQEKRARTSNFPTGGSADGR